MRRDEHRRFKVSFFYLRTGHRFVDSVHCCSLYCGLGFCVCWIPKLWNGCKVSERPSKRRRVVDHDKVNVPFGSELFLKTSQLLNWRRLLRDERSLTGKNANHRRELITSKKFDAFREMAKGKDKDDGEKSRGRNEEGCLSRVFGP